MELKTETKVHEVFKKVRLNARGNLFEIPLASFLKYRGDSRLGKLSNYRHMSVEEILQLCDHFNPEIRDW
jgi:hypothetical protein